MSRHWLLFAAWACVAVAISLVAPPHVVILTMTFVGLYVGWEWWCDSFNDSNED